ncbi:esterase family protein [Frigoribacterium sp. CFBP 13707]|uniref:alpha/beta hydrolase n=1 Tax=Frigoribacterium sp. CFBP 13707 TaxID=2775313 RepID=UPI001786E506|nr:alpha/beta hydrolase-fold protein [Frigoribacterium sp. CFBP 13707]MBD8728186.1 esterase [Frigoribacterium sp. CFBP 13707]
MKEDLLTLPLTSTPLLAVVYGVALVLAVLVAWPPRRGRRAADTAADASPRRWWRRVLLTAVAGAAVGALASWVLGDLLDVAGVPPTWVDRTWFSAVLAAVAVAVAALVRTSAAKRVVAGLGVVVFVTAGALAINRDAGAYPTLAEALGESTIAPLSWSENAAGSAPGALDPQLYASWTPPADMPAHGRYGTVHIPGTVSGFPARDAVVWLPPAALVADPPPLPVVVMMSGQPASPEAVVTAGGLVTTLEAYAAADHGLAPIAVVPDQLSADDHNPMCVDGALGNSATYVTTDVVDYVTSHYRVATGPRAWAIGGFSQGGTCSIQFGSARPDLFGSIVDVSGEVGPSLGSVEQTVADGFAGDRAAYDAAQPQAIMAAHAPYADTAAFFAVGGGDPTFGAAMAANSSAAEAAGMHVTRWVSPGTGHDWTTATRGFAVGIGDLYPRWGLSASALSPADPSTTPAATATPAASHGGS